MNNWDKLDFTHEIFTPILKEISTMDERDMKLFFYQNNITDKTPFIESLKVKYTFMFKNIKKARTNYEQLYTDFINNHDKIYDLFRDKSKKRFQSFVEIFGDNNNGDTRVLYEYINVCKKVISTDIEDISLYVRHKIKAWNLFFKILRVVEKYSIHF